jgi:putative transposase
MAYDPQKHHRHSIRLKGYDYTRAGAYFVTICTQKRELLFDPPPVREMIQRWWDKLPEKFTNVETDAFVIMPNHIHGIVVLVGVDPCVDPIDPWVDRENGQSRGIALMGDGFAPTVRMVERTHEVGRTHGFAPTDDMVSLAKVVRWFKTMTTNEYIHGVKQTGWAPFAGKLWQRNYYEIIIRNENHYNHIRAYILNNPQRWQEDPLHPSAPPTE